MKEEIHSNLYMIKLTNSILDKLENKKIVTEGEYNVLLTALAIHLILENIVGKEIYNNILDQAYKNIKNNDKTYLKN